MNRNLNTIMQGLAEHLHQARTRLPGVDDASLIIIAEAMAKAAPPEKSYQAFPTLKAAIADYLEGVDNARTGEVYKVMQTRYPDLLSNKNPYDSVSQTLQGEDFERICRGRYRLRPEPESEPHVSGTHFEPYLSEKAKATYTTATYLTQPFLARDVVSSGQLKMPSVIIGLKELRKAGMVEIAEKLTNGMARWQVTR